MVQKPYLSRDLLQLHYAQLHSLRRVCRAIKLRHNRRCDIGLTVNSHSLTILALSVDQTRFSISNITSLSQLRVTLVQLQ